MKVFHQSVGVFDPDCDWDGDKFIDEDDNGVEHVIPTVLVEKLGDGRDIWKSANRFEVFKGEKDAGECECPICKGCVFSVARANWSTYVKCVACGTEFCVHDG